MTLENGIKISQCFQWFYSLFINWYQYSRFFLNTKKSHSSLMHGQNFQFYMSLISMENRRV